MSPSITQGISSRPAIAISTYSSGQALGGIQSYSLPVASTANGGGAMGFNLVVIDLEKKNAPLTLFLYSGQPSAINDQATYNPTAADALLCIGYVSVVANDYKAVGANWSIAQVSGNVPLGSVAGPIYAQAMIEGTITWTATNSLVFKLGTLTD